MKMKKSRLKKRSRTEGRDLKTEPRKQEVDEPVEACSVLP